jgi:hypothetical protein
MKGLWHRVRFNGRRIAYGVVLMGLAGLSRAEDFVPNHIPLSPQLAEPHDAWVTLVPGIVLTVLSSFIWIFGKKRGN